MKIILMPRASWLCGRIKLLIRGSVNAWNKVASEIDSLRFISSFTDLENREDNLRAKDNQPDCFLSWNLKKCLRIPATLFGLTGLYPFSY